MTAPEDHPTAHTREALAARIEAAGARVRPKAGSRLMRTCGVLLRLVGNPRFQTEYFTTIGRTIYYPTTVQDPLAYADVMEHELVHVQQWRRYGPLFSVSYLLLPVPVLLAWCRWRWEREAYLIQLRAANDAEATIAWAVDRIWRDYAFPWPKPWMRRWFRRAVGA